MADFPYSPDFGSKLMPKYPVLITPYANGYEQRRLVHATKLRSGVLSFSNRSSVEMAAVIAFFDAKFEGLTAFTITVHGGDISVRFIPETFSYTLISRLLYTYQFQVQEVVA